MHKYTLSMDPSGNYYEGKGTTGWCVLNNETKEIIETDSITAQEYSSQCSYWLAHIDLINAKLKKYKDVAVVVEDYLLYSTAAKDQINSKMETSQLLGVLKVHCFIHDIPIIMHKASLVKKRWSDFILQHEGYIYKQKKYWYCLGSKYCLCDHQRDAIRHAIHFNEFENKE